MRMEPRKPPSSADTGNHRGSQALNHQHALARHPVRHVDAHRVPERAADGREGDAGVAAGGLGNHVAGRDFAACVGALQDVQRHAVLDAAGEVVGLVLGVDALLAAAITTVDFEQRRGADQARQCEKFGGGGRVLSCGPNLTVRTHGRPLDAATKNIVTSRPRTLHPARDSPRIPLAYTSTTPRARQGECHVNSGNPAWWRPR